MTNNSRTVNVNYRGEAGEIKIYVCFVGLQGSFAELCWTQLYLDQLTNKTAGLVLLYESLILRPMHNRRQLSGACFPHGRKHGLKKLSQTTQACLKPLTMKDKALSIYQWFLHTWVFPTVLKEIISAYLLPVL